MFLKKRWQESHLLTPSKIQGFICIKASPQKFVETEGIEPPLAAPKAKIYVAASFLVRKRIKHRATITLCPDLVSIFITRIQRPTAREIVLQVEEDSNPRRNKSLLVLETSAFNHSAIDLFHILFPIW